MPATLLKMLGSFIYISDKIEIFFVCVKLVNRQQSIAPFIIITFGMLYKASQPYLGFLWKQSIFPSASQHKYALFKIKELCFIVINIYAASFAVWLEVCPRCAVHC